MASQKIVALCLVVIVAACQVDAFVRAGREYIPGDMARDTPRKRPVPRAARAAFNATLHKKRVSKTKTYIGNLRYYGDKQMKLKTAIA